MKFWKFPYQYRVTDYGHGLVKTEQWFLGLWRTAWNVESVFVVEAQEREQP